MALTTLIAFLSYQEILASQERIESAPNLLSAQGSAVTEEVTKPDSHGISVLGEVNKPGVYPVLSSRKLFDMISAVFEEQKFGLPVRDALMNLTERMPLVDVKFFVTAVMLQRETGGNLAEILDNLSYVIRERFKIMRQVRVYTAQGRLTMMLLMGLPPLIIVIMLMTSLTFIRPLFADPIGHIAVVVFCFLAAAYAPSSLLGARLRTTIKMVMLFVLPAIIFVTLGPAFIQLIRTLMAGH